MRGLLLLLLVDACLTWLGVDGSAPAPCVALTGIASGGGGDEGTLDLDALLISLEYEPFNLSNPTIPTVAGCSSGLETPIGMRNLLAIDTTAFSVANMFQTKQAALDIFGDKETSDARRRCQPGPGEDTTLFDLHLRVAIIYTVVYGGLQAMPYCLEELEPLMEERGHPLSLILEDDPSVDTPWGLAKAYYDEIDAYLTENDGWNADGSLSREYNRIPYSDFSITDSAGNSWTPYRPKNTPYKLVRQRRWQPLVESNGLGYISAQEHVTPYIGVTGRFFGFNSSEDEEAFASRILDPPDYKYRRAAKDALKESTITATDDFKQAAVSFFDNKFSSLVPLKIAYFLQPTTNLTAQDFYRITVEVQLSLYNGIILSWREKIRHDAPRPPSVVKSKLGEKLVEAYAGEGQGVQMIKASEWEPFIRTMPHSEYPSASACLCETYADQVALYMGTDEIDPPVELGSFSFSSWSEISQVCGDSRAWGGMHFKDAVPAGAELCGGGLMAPSISASIGRLIDGDESAAIFKKDIGELMLRPL